MAKASKGGSGSEAKKEGAPKVKLSNLCKDLMKEKGTGVSISEAISWLSTKYPHVEYNKDTLSTTLSAVRKKLSGAGKKLTAPTVNDLMQIKNLAEANGGLEKFQGLFDLILGAARSVGGIDRLRQCLDGLRDLAR